MLATALIKVVLPAWEKSLDFHPASFSWVFPNISLKKDLFEESKLRGGPRYLILEEELLKFRKSFTE